MKRMITLMLLILPLAGFSQSSEVNDFTEKMADLMTEFQENVLSEDKCEDIWHDVGDYKEEIDKFRSEGDFDREDAKMLLFLSNIAALFDDYFICVGGWNSYPMECDRFFEASNLFEASKIVYISKDVYCVDIIEYQLGSFVAYFMVNNAAKNYRINYLFSAENGTRSGEIGLAHGTMRMIMDNREKPVYGYKISKVTCERF